MSDTNSTDLKSGDSIKKSATQSVALSIGSALLDQVKPEYRAASQHFPVSGETTVAAVLEAIGLSTQQSLLVVLNDALVTRPDLSLRQVSNGDSLSFMPPIHAG